MQQLFGRFLATRIGGDLGGLLFSVAVAEGIIVATWQLFLVRLSTPARAVDRETCDCSCWDGLYKNGYDLAGYKSVYFNFDERILGLLMWSALYFVLAVAAFRHVLGLVFRGEARWPFVLLFLIGLYPQHYGMWCTWNYLNEDFRPMLPTQLFFAMTEVLIGLVVVCLCRVSVATHPALLWAVVGTCAVHIIRSRIDQTSPLVGVAIMLAADCAHVVVCAAYLYAAIGAQFLSISTAVKQGVAPAAAPAASGVMEDVNTPAAGTACVHAASKETVAGSARSIADLEVAGEPHSPHAAAFTSTAPRVRRGAPSAAASDNIECSGADATDAAIKSAHSAALLAAGGFPTAVYSAQDCARDGLLTGAGVLITLLSFLL